MAKIFIKNNEGLIGDFLGTIPVMQEFSKGNEVIVQIHPAAKELFGLINPKYDLVEGNPNKDFQWQTYREVTLSSPPAFDFSERRGLYMTDTYLNMNGFSITPQKPAKADLIIPPSDYPVDSVDYVIAPYSRSLPDDQRWPIENWKELIRRNSDKRFAVLGTHKQDNPDQWDMPNCYAFFDNFFSDVAHLMLASKHGLISVVSGPSHFAFHLGVQSYLICNQKGAWGRNPDAILINYHIPDLTVEKVLSYLK